MCELMKHVMPAAPSPASPWSFLTSSPPSPPHPHPHPSNPPLLLSFTNFPFILPQIPDADTLWIA
jgi:hypothetical protein